MDNSTRNAEALKAKATILRRAKEDINEAERSYATNMKSLERRAVDLATWRDAQLAQQQAVFDAAVRQIEEAFTAEMERRMPGELQQIRELRDTVLQSASAAIEQAEADYQSLLVSMSLTRAAEPIAAIRMSRARWRVLHDAGLKRAATLELWSSSDYSVKLYKKLRRALRLEEGAALPPEVEAALQPTQAELDEAMVWATTPDENDFRQIDDTKVDAQVGVPYVPDPATMPAVDPAVLAKMDELLGH